MKSGPSTILWGKLRQREPCSSVLGKTWTLVTAACADTGEVGVITGRSHPARGMEAPSAGLTCLPQQVPEGLQPAAQGTLLGRHWPR